MIDSAAAVPGRARVVESVIRSLGPGREPTAGPADEPVTLEAGQRPAQSLGRDVVRQPAAGGQRRDDPAAHPAVAVLEALGRPPLPPRPRTNAPRPRLVRR